ncbi:hypothetical protein VPH35_139523 [Triticum aestivum]|uniref:Acidic protein n=2 Tax=Aegilops tauschii subsp. strangulata TaxID=200361 RepID=A0A453SWA1_AEGTS
MDRSMNPFHTAVIALSVLLLVCFVNHGQCRTLGHQDMGSSSKINISPGGLCVKTSCSGVTAHVCFCCLIDSTCHSSLAECEKESYCQRSSTLDAAAATTPAPSTPTGLI